MIMERKASEKTFEPGHEQVTPHGAVLALQHGRAFLSDVKMPLEGKMKNKEIITCLDGKYCGGYGLHTLCPFCGKCAKYPESMNYRGHDAHIVCVRKAR